MYEDEFELVGEGNHNVSYDTTGNNTIISHSSFNKNSKTNCNPKKQKNDRLGRKSNGIKYTSFRNGIIQNIEKDISMGDRENLLKAKIKKSQEKYLNFANLAIQEFCNCIELDIKDVHTLLYPCTKAVESKLGVRPKRKKKLTKRKNKKKNKTKWKINIQMEVETLRGRMLILRKIERNKDPKTRKDRKV